MVFGGCYASLSRRSLKPSLPSQTCTRCLPPRKISGVISASHQENVRTKTPSGKLAPMGAALVAALWAAAPGSAGGHKARPYPMHFLQF